jgi:hypothetical protein
MQQISFTAKLFFVVSRKLYSTPFQASLSKEYAQPTANLMCYLLNLLMVTTIQVCPQFNLFFCYYESMFRTTLVVDMLLHSFWFAFFIRFQQKIESLPRVLVSICMAEQVASFSMYTGLLTI